MNEQEGRRVVSHVIAMCKVFGGDIRQMCAQRGVPDDLISKLLAEQNFGTRASASSTGTAL